MAKKQKLPLYFWVLDLWPESVQAAAGFNNKLIMKFLNKMVVSVYRNCTNILIGSEGYRKSIIRKGDFDRRLIYFPNWAEDISVDSATINISEIFPFSNLTIDDFVVLFAGNIGEAQNLDKIIEAARLTKKNLHIKWIFLGDGRNRTFLENKVNEYYLQETVFFPGRFPLNSMPVFINKADVLLVSLKDEQIFNLTVPSKVQFYMAQGKPILGSLNGEGSDLISKAKCGYCVPAGDYKACAEIVNKIYNEPKELKLLGENGQKYYDKHFRKKDRIDQLENIFNRNVVKL
jgi:glycosyltransferase involved in cell wall biosynthesis